ncbi:MULTISPECIES: YqgE/AlgH family protein [Vitreoscilla]|uniref:UPF0301 protein LVJ81_05855 n=1 Tax=Vitreoscilla stercoraria TaxID=61 RepID=A0ABY4ECS3_VITST|nr:MULTISPECIES: YqgE/AlgH family protein [Vitreoscilla]AUZ05096.2 hypothetical protein ADP71_15010 [Vitreoscilla sp. C1]UOO93548.1 YqgE/AlgH family protein [Vitreoscilla stercoraria]
MTKTNQKIENLANYFLIAMPNMDDTFFSGSVVYICEHNEDGAMGVVINKPSPLTMNQLFEAIQQRTPLQYDEQAVLMGGPVQVDRGFLLHTPVGDWESSVLVSEDIAFTTSRDIIEDLAHNTQNTEAKTLATIGYAGWKKNQLEDELAKNAWLTVKADQHIMFDLPVAERYNAALQLLGINPANLVQGAGHA